jgi:hypothetical protein
MKLGVWPSVCLAVLLLLPFEASPVARAYPASVYTSQARSHGVVLSLSLTHRTYPQDALVRVTVRLVNVSQHAVLIGGTEAAVCVQQGPGIRVTDSTDRRLYPPAITWLLASCGPPIIPRPLLPGHVVQRRFLAVLRGDRIQAVASFGDGSVQIVTPPLSLRLVSEPAPRAVVHIASLPYIDVTASTTVQRGRFYYMESELCWAAGSNASGTVGSAFGVARFRFTLPNETGVYRFPTECGSPTRWSFTGGWLNHRAVTVDYTPPAQVTP